MWRPFDLELVSLGYRIKQKKGEELGFCICNLLFLWVWGRTLG